MVRTLLGVVFSLLGAIVGAAVGTVLFDWGLRQGLYALILPGAALGLGVHLASLERSQVRGIFSAIAAVLLGIVNEWRHFPFVKDEGLGYFLMNVYKLVPFTLLMIAIGGFFGFWWGKQASPWASRFGKPVQMKRRVEGMDD